MEGEKKPIKFLTMCSVSNIFFSVDLRAAADGFKHREEKKYDSIDS